MSGTETVTLLFTDLVDSTGTLSSVGEQRYEGARRAHFDAMRSAIASSGGREVKTIGDAFMVAFSGPSNALACGAAMQQLQHAANGRPGGFDLGLRIGISAGEVTPEGGDYFGLPVVEASRLCGMAEGGQVLVAEIVKVLAGSRGGHEFRGAGEYDLKGFDQPVTACELLWEPDATVGRLPLPSALASVERTPFIGRVALLDRLRAARSRAVESRRQIVLMAGEPGIGKTRLATELALEAHRDGATVLFGRCDEEGLLPYQPFVEGLRFYSSVCPLPELQRQLGVGGADIARIVPDLATRLPVGDSIAGDPEGERYRLFDSVNTLLEAASRERPLVFVVDDLHWADRPTLLMLKHIVRSPEPCQLLVIGTYRETSLARPHPLLELLADLRASTPAFERILLRGLDEAEVEALVQSVAPHAVTAASQALAHHLAEETEGNAFFLHEIVRHLKETGAIYERDGLWVTEAGSINDLGVPEGVREVVGRRLSRLSDRCNQALSRAAVVGREFSLPVLERIVDIQSDELIDLLEEAVAAGLVDEVPQQADVYRFSHAIVRETLYGELPTARRLRLHRQTGEALEALGAAESPEQLPQLAYHFCEAAPGGDRAKAFHYARITAEHAMSIAAWEQATRHFRYCLSTLKDPDDSSREQRAAILTAFGICQRNAGDAEGATQSLNESLDLFRRAGNGLAMAKVALELLSFSSKLTLVPDDSRLGLVDEALELLGAEDPNLRALLLIARARALLFVEGQVGEELSEAAEIVQAHNLRELQAPVLDALMHRAWWQLRIEEARGLAMQGFQAFDKLRSYGEAAHQLDDAAIMWFEEGRLDEAAAVSKEVLAYARKYQLRRPEQETLAQQAAMALLRCDDALFRSLINQAPTGYFQRLLASMAADIAGDFSRALQTIPAAEDRLWVSGDHGARARCLLHAGDKAGARSDLDAWAHTLPSATVTGGSRQSAYAQVDDALLLLAEDDAARHAYADLKRLAPIRVAAHAARGLDPLRGALALRLGLVEEAQQWYKTGVEWAKRERCPLEEGRGLRGLAEVALCRGHQREALLLLDQAAAIFEQHGAKLYLDQVVARKVGLLKRSR